MANSRGDYPCRPCSKSVDSSLSTRRSSWRCLSGEVAWAEDAGKITVAGMGLMDPRRGCKWGNQLRDHWNSPGRIQLSQCQQEWRWAGVEVRFSGGREEGSEEWFPDSGVRSWGRHGQEEKRAEGRGQTPRKQMEQKEPEKQEAWMETGGRENLEEWGNSSVTAMEGGAFFVLFRFSN